MGPETVSSGLSPDIYEQFEPWLGLQPRNVAVVLAARSALRALPEVVRGIGTPQASFAWHTERYAGVAFRSCAIALRCATSDSSQASREAGLAYGDSFQADGRYTAIRAARVALNVALSETDERAAQLCFNEIRRDWYTAARDARFLERGETVQQLARQKLWIESTTPGYIARYWQDLIGLLPEGHDWEVWIDWYERLLNGGGISEERAAIYADVPARLWDKDAKEANAWIKEHLVAGPAVPAVMPATVEPILVGELVTLSQKPLDADLAAADIAAALAALKSRFERLLGEIERANIDPRFPAIVRDFIDRLPSTTPDTETLFDMGAELAALRGYESTVISEWPNALSPRYSAAVLTLDLTLQKFPKWREFAAAPGPAITLEQAEETAALSHVVAADLRAPGIAEHVDPLVPETFDALAERSKQIAAGISQMNVPAQATIARDQLESVNNLLKLSASIALASSEVSRLAASARKHLAGPATVLSAATKSGAKYVGGKMWEGAKEPLDNFFKESGKKLASSAVAFLGFMRPIAIGWLISEFPAMFSWLKPILQQLGWL